MWSRNFWIEYNRSVMESISQSVSSVAQSFPTLCDPMNHSTPGLPVHHQLPEFIQTHVHQVGDAIQPSHPLSSPSPPAFNLSQHQGLFKWVGSSYQVSRVLELQLQHQFFQWVFRLISFRTDWFDLVIFLTISLVGSSVKLKDSTHPSLFQCFVFQRNEVCWMIFSRKPLLN